MMMSDAVVTGLGSINALDLGSDEANTSSSTSSSQI